MRRSFALAMGGVAALVYVVGSLVSARLGAQSAPLLDGLQPPPPYKWVNPPEELAAQNEEPEGGSFEVEVGRNGSTAGAFSTPDAQATVIISDGSIPAAPQQEGAVIEIRPLDPATLGPPPSGLEFAGNAYAITATYQPGGEAVPGVSPGGDQRVIMVYPSAPSEPGHQAVTMLASPDGDTWERLETSDNSAQQQAQVTFEDFGYFVVARPPEPSGLSSSAIGVVILSVILLGLGGLVLMRNIRRDRSPRA